MMERDLGVVYVRSSHEQLDPTAKHHVESLLLVANWWVAAGPVSESESAGLLSSEKPLSEV
eukprot:COSAG01_NODE_99_length_26583_cov_79.512536_19_plen_61_part_00